MTGPTATISFGEHLASNLRRFSEELRTAQFDGSFLSELVLCYAGLQEEGQLLFPTVFICLNSDEALLTLDASDFIVVGQARYSLRSIQKMFKRSALLASHSNWAILIELEDERFHFGLIRMNHNPLEKTSFDRLRLDATESSPIIGLSRLGRNFIEIRSNSGECHYIALGMAEESSSSPQDAVTQLSQLTSSDANPATRTEIATLYARVGYTMLHSDGGSLIVVLRQDSLIPDFLEDGVLLREPVDMQEAVELALTARDYGESQRRLDSYTDLILSMATMDGITVLTSTGSILGYNFFIKSDFFVDDDERFGGARRRAYETLIQQATPAIAGVFYKSHDGGLSVTCF